MVEDSPKKILVGTPHQLEIDGLVGEHKLSYLMLNLPWSCDMACGYCYREGEKSNDSFTRSDLKRRLEVISETADLGAKTLLIAGQGEPLLRRELTMQLIEHASSEGLTTLLYTNGTHLDSSTVDELFTKNVSLVTSLDALDLAIFEKITHYKHLDRLMANLEGVRDRYGAAVRLREDGLLETRWGVISVINNHNEHEIPKIKEFCAEDAYYIVNFLINEGAAKNIYQDYVGSPENLKRLVEIANVHTDTDQSGISLAGRSGQCIFLQHGLIIDADGNSQACPGKTGTDLANISDTSVKQLWERTRAYANAKGNPACIARDMRVYCSGANDMRLATDLRITDISLPVLKDV